MQSKTGGLAALPADPAAAGNRRDRLYPANGGAISPGQVLGPGAWRLDRLTVTANDQTVRSKNSPGGRTFADEARRRQLIDCAIEVIAEEGFAQASLARIAQRAGVAKSVVLYHFANKNELIEHVLAAVSNASAGILPERLATVSTARDKLRVLITALIEYIATHRTEALAGLETWNMTRSLPTRTRLAQQLGEAGSEGIEELLAEGQRNGEFGEFDPHVLAVMFRQAIDAATLEFAINPDLDLTAFAAEIVAMFDRATARVGT